MEQLPMTREGVERLEDELKRLTNDERPAIIQAIATAREHGDLKENAEYHAARERQSFVEGRISELESIVSLSVIIDPSSLSGDVVRFGATVLLADEDTDEETTYQIVGTHEAKIEDGKLSVTAPMARALIGKSLGDSIEVVSPGGSKGYEIVKVEYI
ncbi:MAG: transcription elongation factor GreA [Rhodospirillaceae bacterium]|jgi:transcription elongation factor GreA|nr:transcription elongation factor GreA [Rhodospirillaceae bacterium]MBT4219268.1 transcription elongation factor GreA [Rhodospirillaceae bacterium]MBT5309299.1 transcription elongation factor GreA [Rhodospirillaceae bacterium]MBT6407748.1 transcription elongation factor GreA [Rhodospirillaceae bacterium]MBT7354830.1 transcription elongation factor GreA [Rhodospirillaceae bacterium]